MNENQIQQQFMRFIAIVASQMNATKVVQIEKSIFSG